MIKTVSSGHSKRFVTHRHLIWGEFETYRCIYQGHQQVNNLAEKNQISQNKLLGDETYDLDSKPQEKAKGINSKVEAVGKVHGGKNGRGQGKSVQKCYQNRQKS